MNIPRTSPACYDWQGERGRGREIRREIRKDKEKRRECDVFESIEAYFSYLLYSLVS
jgi:hypothetical protein